MLGDPTPMAFLRWNTYTHKGRGEAMRGTTQPGALYAKIYSWRALQVGRWSGLHSRSTIVELEPKPRPSKAFQEGQRQTNVEL